MAKITLSLALSTPNEYELWNIPYETTAARVVCVSELDADTAFEQSRVLADLRSWRPKRLVEEVTGVENRLNLAWEHSAGRQVLSNRNAEGRVVVFHCPL